MFTLQRVTDLVKAFYGKEVTVKPLTGEYDFNYLLSDENGSRYIFKIASDEHGFSFFDAQVQILNHLAASEVSHLFNHHIKSIDNREIIVLDQEGKRYYLRLLNFLDGQFWMNLQHRSDALHVDLGMFLGEMDKALQNFSHPAMHRHYVWNISNAMDANKKLHCIKNHERRRIAGYFLLQFETEVLPHVSSLRHAYAHHDANDTNLLVIGDKISGLIDFGDMVYTALINNLAVACTYAMMNCDNPLHVASLVVEGYHSAYQLTAQEVDLLYYLIAARLCISVTQSAFNASIETNNEHHFISEKPAWDLLNKLIRINPIKAQDSFRRACGFEGVITYSDYASLLKDRKEYIGRNLSTSYKEKLKIVKGALQYLYDDKGQTFVDCVNNPSHVGHGHPVVVRQMHGEAHPRPLRGR